MRTALLLFTLIVAVVGTARSEIAAEHIRQDVEIPFPDGRESIEARLFLPSGFENPPLVIWNHGSSLGEEQFHDEFWWHENHLLPVFLGKGYAVLMPIRRGFGNSDDELVETEYSCDGASPDFYKEGLEAARDVMAALDYAESLVQIDRNRIVLAGLHAGGFANLAAASLQPVGVIAILGISVGRSDDSTPPRVCFGDKLSDAIGQYARNVLPPMLWLYPDDDRSIPRDVGREWYEIYRNSGGIGEFQVVRAGDYDDEEALFGEKEAEQWLQAFEQFMRNHGLTGFQPDFPRPGYR